jgi:hypothetical protein
MMKKSEMVAMLFAGAMMMLGFGVLNGGSATAADDPYAPLRLYDGKWSILPGEDGKGWMQLENHCAKTGLFFACEQMVDGKSAALVVFLPFAKMASGGEEYRTQALLPDASPAGEWSKMTIEGDKWVYFWDSTDAGKKTYWKNVNTFSGTDKIHFEILNSEDGNTWKKQKSGDEQRAK